MNKRNLNTSNVINILILKIGIKSTNSRYKQTVKAIRLISIDHNEGTKTYRVTQSPSQYSVEQFCICLPSLRYWFLL